MHFLDENFDPLVESLLTENEDDENDKDTIWNQISSFAERKLRGYSTKEVDVFVSKAKKVNSEESKRDLLSSLRSAIKDATDASKTDDEEKKKELRLQLEVLKQLERKVSSYNPMKDKDGEKDEDGDDKKDRDVLNLDEL